MIAREQALEASQPTPIEILLPFAALATVVAIVGSAADSKTVWYVIRGTGVIAYVLLAASVIIGMMISSRAAPAGRPRVDLYEIHNFTSLLALAFGAVHGLALLLDNYIGFSAHQILIPFTSTYRPVAVSMGIVGAYLAAAIYGSFWARRWVGYRRWRQLHYLTFVSFVLVTLHGMFGGVDAHEMWMVTIYATACAAVLGLIVFRLAATSTAERKAA